MVIMPALIIPDRWNHGQTIQMGVDAQDVFAMRWALFGTPGICLPKETALRQETQTLCENRLISSHQFIKL